MKSTVIPALGAGLLFATIALQGAQAQPAPRSGSRDELRACMNSETDVTARRQALTGRSQKEAKELTEEQQRLERDQKPMDRSGRKVKAHNERVKAAQTSADAFRVELESVNKALVAYNDSCGRISFMLEDKAAILKEREPAKN